MKQPFSFLPRTGMEARELNYKYYFTGKKCKHGHIAPRTSSSSSCVYCSYKYPPSELFIKTNLVHEHRDTKKYQIAKNKRAVKNSRRYPIQFYARKAAQRAKHRAAKQKVPYTITAAYIVKIFPDVCPVFKTPFTFGGGSFGGINNSTGPSIDRIDPKKGYVPGNVAIISWKANRIKTNATAKELLKVGIWLQNQGC